MKLRNCFRWKPTTPKDVQLWAKTLANMFGGGRQSFREHLAESLAAVTSGQVDVKKEGLAMESCGKGDLSYHNRRFNCVQLKLCGLVERRAALDSLSRSVHQLDQLTVNGKFEVTLKHDVRTSDAHCDHGVQSHNVHHALTTISSIELYSHDDDINLAVLAACRL